MCASSILFFAASISSAKYNLFNRSDKVDFGDDEFVSDESKDEFGDDEFVSDKSKDEFGEIDEFVSDKSKDEFGDIDEESFIVSLVRIPFPTREVGTILGIFDEVLFDDVFFLR